MDAVASAEDSAPGEDEEDPEEEDAAEAGDAARRNPRNGSPSPSSAASLETARSAN